MCRRQRRRPSEYEPGKNSFCASPSPESTAQTRRAVKSAIDESLCTVRFNAHDARSVLSAVHGKKKQHNVKKKRRHFKPDFAFTCALMLMLALPLSIYGIRSRENITTVVTGPGQSTPHPDPSTQPDADVISPMPTAAPTIRPTDIAVTETADGPSPDMTGLLTESEAIHIARECFQAHCDTTIFAFEEYEISTAFTGTDAPQYTVTMECIYKNGCSFSVILSAQDGSILQYSTPKLATMPAFVNMDTPEVRAWFDKYGEQLLTWPQDVQAEFSRRYQGGTLRAAREDEISYETALAAVSNPVISEAPGMFTAFYPVLYSERASAEGRAYYVVYCYAQEITDGTPEGEPMTVSFDAKTGDIISIENNPLEGALDIAPIQPTK